MSDSPVDSESTPDQETHRSIVVVDPSRHRFTDGRDDDRGAEDDHREVVLFLLDNLLGQGFRECVRVGLEFREAGKGMGLVMDQGRIINSTHCAVSTSSVSKSTVSAIAIASFQFASGG